MEDQNKMKECLIHEDFLFKLMEVGLIFEDKPQLFRTLDKPDILAIDSNIKKTFTEKEKNTLINALSVLIDSEQDTIDRTKLISKVRNL